MRTTETGICVTTARETGEHLAAGSLFVALPSRVSVAPASLPTGETLLALRIRSIRGLLEAEHLPSHSTILAVASRSEEFRRTAIAVLVAVGIPPLSLCQIDPAHSDWRERVRATEIAIVDAVAARELDPELPFRLFRIISDECLCQLREMTNPV